VSKSALLQKKAFRAGIVRRQALEQAGKLKQLVPPIEIADLDAGQGLTARGFGAIEHRRDDSMRCPIPGRPFAFRVRR
jgi:hypothetical protein